MKPKRIKSNTVYWERLANKLARRFAPRIHPCRDCGGPVIEWWCCTRCGSQDPRRTR